MVNRKSIRTRGKLSLSRFFQKLNSGDKVTVVKERSSRHNFPERLQGRTGTVKERRGKIYVVEIKDHDKKKTFFVEPIHLKKIKAL